MRQEVARDRAVVVLAVVSGTTDAIGFVALGGAFTSVMTGNMVLVGIGAAHGEGSLATHALAAIVCFILGCAAGTRLAGSAATGDPAWPAPVSRALVAEAAVLALYAVLWEATGAEPGPDLQLLLLVVNAFALGIQSSTIQRFGVSGLSTTYMTGTLTTLVIKLVSGRPVREVAHSIQLLIGLIGGAALGTAIVAYWPAAAPLPQLAGLAIALCLGWTATRGTGRRRLPQVMTAAGRSSADGRSGP